jgi:hypothetical protein
LARQIDDAQNAADAGPPRRLTSKAPKTEALKLAEQYDALVAEAASTAVTVTVRALPRREWRDLKAKHPPREGNERDEAVGANLETLPDDAVPACIVDGVPEAQREAFLEDLADGDWQNLAELVRDINERATSIPKLSAVSLLQSQAAND